VEEEGVDDANEQDGEHGPGNDPRGSHSGAGCSAAGEDNGNEHVRENGEICEDNPEHERKGVIYLKGANALEGESEPRDSGNATGGRSNYGPEIHRGFHARDSIAAGLECAAVVGHSLFCKF